MSGTSISYPHYVSSLKSSSCGGMEQRPTTMTKPATATNEVASPRSARQSRIGLRSSSVTMATCYSSYELTTAQQPTNRPLNNTNGTGGGGVTSSVGNSVQVQQPQQQQKDYSRPLHVDCSVEYELPNQAKPPAGVRNEPLLMIHPCYFRKIESQRRSPFVNNLPITSTRQPLQQQQQPPLQPALQQQQQQQHQQPTVAAPKRRPILRGQQIPQQMPQQAAQYPVQYADNRHLWDPMGPLVSITTASGHQTYCKRDTTAAALVTAATCASYNHHNTANSHHWTESVVMDRSPDRPAAEDKHILTGKYRQYLRAHRLHPYVASAIPLASTFPQIQQVCYNV